MKTHATIWLTVLTALMLLVVGCRKLKDDPVGPQLIATAYDDAAYSIAGAVGDESGGATEVVGDLLTVQSQGKINLSAPSADGGFETTTSDSGLYDPATGWWTVSINKSRTNFRVTASITRNYQFRFWKNETEYQQFYVTNEDTASKMEFKMVSGSGYFKNPHVTHTLTQLQGAWLASNINKDTVTITLTENYIRKGVDSVVTLRASRIFDHTLTLTSANLTTTRFNPRRFQSFMMWRANLANALSGTITGRITATITFIRGEDDKVRNIDREFTVTVGGGDGSIALDGKKFKCDMRYGDRP